MDTYPGPIRSYRTGDRERGREGERKGGRERQGEREAGREGGREGEREGGREKLYLSSQSDDTGEVAPILGHTLEVAEHTLELGSLRCHSSLTAYIHTQK